jgi:hypothetical protein
MRPPWQGGYTTVPTPFPHLPITHAVLLELREGSDAVEQQLAASATRISFAN